MRKILFLLLLLLCLALPAAAQRIVISAPGQQALPLALVPFLPAPGQVSLPAVANELNGVLQGDLDLSGLFSFVNPAAFLQDARRPGLTSVEIDYNEWRLLGADMLIKGTYQQSGGQLVIEARLFDVARRQMVTGRRYVGRSEDLRTIGHTFADQILEELTGERGPFNARIAYIGKPARKELFLMETDGARATQLTKHHSIVINPDFAPGQRELLFTSYRRGNPDLYRKALLTGSETIIARKPGLNAGGRYSPDGRFIALTQSEGDNTEIVLLRADGSGRRQLTRHPGIDTDPSWNPDGQSLAFVSDRRGNPHIFITDLAGNEPRRLTFDGRYNSTPAWSPKGDRIAFTRMEGGRFDIFTIRPDGSDERQLTFGAGNKEHPRWSPDGRFLVFSNDVEGYKAVYVMRADGTGMRRITPRGVHAQHPAWSERW